MTPCSFPSCCTAADMSASSCWSGGGGAGVSRDPLSTAAVWVPVLSCCCCWPTSSVAVAGAVAATVSLGLSDAPPLSAMTVCMASDRIKSRIRSTITSDRLCGDDALSSESRAPVASAESSCAAVLGGGADEARLRLESTCNSARRTPTSSRSKSLRWLAAIASCSCADVVDASSLCLVSSSCARSLATLATSWADTHRNRRQDGHTHTHTHSQGRQHSRTLHL